MSYRNDQDAALARVDAITQEVDRSEAERDRMRAEMDPLRTPSSRATIKPSKLGVTVLAVTIGVCAAVFSQHSEPDTGPSVPPELEPPAALPKDPPPATAPLQTLPPSAARAAAPAAADDSADDAARITTVEACFARVQKAVTDGHRDDLRPLRASCRPELATLISHRAAPAAVTDVLTRWLALEDQLSPSLAAYNTYILRDPEAAHYRAPRALREEFDAALQARNAFMPDVRTALHRLESRPRTGPLARVIVRAPLSPTLK